MEEKPSVKFFIVQTIISGLPLALIMTISASILGGAGINSRILPLTIVAFILVCVINALFPIPKILEGFPQKFGLNPNSLPGILVGNLAVNFIFTTIINFVLTLINVPKFPDMIFAFLQLYIPIFIISYIVSLIIAPIAAKVAMSIDKH
ncbi:hypothetical protein [Tepidanaerobacter acetatoxydans]|uniref:hypothetical protein n=1 Tax=Tepidanaerobacter acetatoxydans TaxID=499229 RepID=UPI00020C00CF|nr:hypothetical protein [Tepidanaerobacter acetatoxydans]AEE92354.1 hypothetical protein TepRe1_2232 [Tepidanaerobacter acetatoxydans Re1]